MSSYLEWKFLDQLFLLGYKKRSPYLANFPCPICNEVTTSHHHKKRAYLIEKEGKVFFFCHRCGASMSVSRFLYVMDPNLHKEYKFECLREGGHEKEPEPLFIPFKPTWKISGKIELPNINELEENHYARRYVARRHIPSRYWRKIYFAADFRGWVNTLIPNKFDIYETPDPRIVFPFYNEASILHAAQGRSLHPNLKQKYILITIDETVPSVYGLDSVDWNKPVYVVEGPIDSFFLPNCLASIGGDIVSRVKDLPKENIVIVFDNEPRSPHMRQKMVKAIEWGHRIVIWPSWIRAKDINDMILGGISSEDIKRIIDLSTHSGLMAHVVLSAWSKASPDK